MASRLMKILFLSFYYEPDLCAGSFRATAMTQALLEADPAIEIEVLSTQPNRYESFAIGAASREQRGRLEVHRFGLPTHSSGMRDQSRAFLAYAWRVLRHIRSRRYDAVLATSSRLMTAALAALVARRRALPLYLDVRDIFLDTISDVLPSRIASLTAAPLSLIERWTMSRAHHINLVSAGFRDYFSQRYPTVPLTFFTNGIDDEFLGVSAPRRREGRVTEVLYAGNIGEGQGLHLIVPELAQRLPQLRFRVIGDGGRVGILREEIEKRRLANVVLQPPMRRAELVAASMEADILFLHLNNYPAFRKVLPSKLFEYGALGKPVWAGVAGYAAEFVRNEIENSAVFPPCDVEAAVRSLSGLRLEHTPRPGFVHRYARREVTRRLAADIINSFTSCGAPLRGAAAHQSQ
jgi:glycosyltransferase involved in cell wall biosynthesis